MGARPKIDVSSAGGGEPTTCQSAEAGSASLLDPYDKLYGSAEHSDAPEVIASMSDETDAEEEEEGAHEAGATEEAGVEGGASNVGTVTLSAGKARAADRPSARAGATQGAVARSLEQERL